MYLFVDLNIYIYFVIFLLYEWSHIQKYTCQLWYILSTQGPVTTLILKNINNIKLQFVVILEKNKLHLTVLEVRRKPSI